LILQPFKQCLNNKQYPDNNATQSIIITTTTNRVAEMGGGKQLIFKTNIKTNNK